jgi:hypothetical protein
MAFAVKKWFMLQMWRIQQIAAILTLMLLAVSLSLQIYGYMSWRDWPFSSPYTGALVILIALGLMIWVISIIWDMRLKMWREQMTVLIERNPYAKEKMSSKEIVLYGLTWLPVLDKLGKDDPEARASAAALRKWIEEVSRDDAILRGDVSDVLRLTGTNRVPPDGKDAKGSA